MLSLLSFQSVEETARRGVGPDFPAKAVASKPDIILTVGTSTTLVAKSLTSAIPIVFTAASDPIGLVLVASWAHSSPERPALE
jgi:ABC-type uncharacterized transport system substrate-binding protein